MLNEIIFGLNVASFIFIVVSLILIVKARRYEGLVIKDVFNLMLVGLFFIALIILIDLVDSSRIFSQVASVLSQIDFSIFFTGINLFLMPLATICFIAAMFTLMEVR